ncbi:GGDEF domain-containing protein [Nocardioides sp.]|uniref:GGDEF domain-containing protein n=1 Tax=Nocardioides sp. TaxID=35761 RepID=UPI002624922F|nr:GGDEF domain-containing protein [Nocardioides sp.]
MAALNVVALVISLGVALVALIGRRIPGAWLVAATALAVTFWSGCAAISAAQGGQGGYRLDWLNHLVWLAAVALAALGLVVLERRLSLPAWRMPRWLRIATLLDLVFIACLTNPLVELRALSYVDGHGTRHYTILWALQAMVVFALLFAGCTGLVRRAAESTGPRRLLLYAATGAVAVGIGLQAAQIQAMALCGALGVACLAGAVLGTRAPAESGRAEPDVPSDVHAAQLEQALRDPVTGLIGRAALGAVLDDLATQDRFAIIVIDLDGLKPTNDTYGHLLGDECLRATATRIAAAVGDAGTVGRFGGDEFVVALPDLPPEPAVVVAEAIVTAVHRELRTDRATLTPTVSVGVACGEQGHEVADVLHEADRAMYDAKRLGGDRCCLAGRAPTVGEVR